MKRAALITAIALSLAGCGGGGHQSRQSTPSSTARTTTTAATVSTSPAERTTTEQVDATLRTAVRAALAANHTLAIRVLWTNRIPSAARDSTRGPALAELTASAKNREEKGIRVRMIHDTYRVIWIHLGRTRTHPTALAEWDQRVVPSHLNGTPRGGAVSLRERARIELRPADAATSFVVWRVTLVK